VSDPVAAYHELFDDDALATESSEVFRDGQRSHNLFFGEHPLSIVLRPQFIRLDRYRAAALASHELYGALRTLEHALLRDAELRAELDLDPEEERLALADTPGRSSSSSARLDGFLTDRLRYVEYNAETPAGMAYVDNLTAVFESMPLMRVFRKRFRVRALPVRARLLTALLRAFREWGGAETPVIAIVDWAGLPTMSEFEMFREYFEGRGFRTLICDPRELEFRRGRLYARGEHVTLVYRRVLTSDLIAYGDEARPLRDAYLAGAACVANSFRAKLLHKKMSLALLSDDRYAGLYTPAQCRAIERHVPWTRKLRDGPTTRRGEQISDLASYALEHREECVIKPNDEFGGRGVVLGWTVDPHEWEQDLAVAMTQSFVIQESVPVPREPFPVVLDGIKLLDFSIDTDPYLFDGRVAGCLTRLSSSALLNVTAGEGSLVPTYLFEGPRG
jgi:hypothetical protein